MLVVYSSNYTTLISHLKSSFSGTLSSAVFPPPLATSTPPPLAMFTGIDFIHDTSASPPTPPDFIHDAGAGNTFISRLQGPRHLSVALSRDNHNEQVWQRLRHKSWCHQGTNHRRGVKVVAGDVRRNEVAVGGQLSDGQQWRRA